MTMKEKMDKLQQRIAVLVDDLRETQADVEKFTRSTLGTSECPVGNLPTEEKEEEAG